MRIRHLLPGALLCAAVLVPSPTSAVAATSDCESLSVKVGGGSAGNVLTGTITATNVGCRSARGLTRSARP